MTIDEAIAKYKNKAEEHEQIAGWLEELKDIKSDGFTDDLLNMGFTKGYNKAIDDFVCAVKRRFPNDKNGIFHIEEIAEQLKAGARK